MTELRRHPFATPALFGASCWLVAGLMAAPAALAQAAAPPPGTPAAVLPNVQQLGTPLPKADSNAAALPARPPGAPLELARPADEIEIDVSAYTIDGGPPALRAALAEITAPYVGSKRKYEDLIGATVAVTRFLQSTLGYYLGFGYLPAQTPQGGVVRIAVLEGRLDRVVLNWKDGLPVRRDVVEAHLARLKPGSVVTVEDVERVVFLVNDLRGLNARFEFREGREWGTAELVVTPQADERWSNRLDIDSDGSRFSGEYRIGWQSILNSPTGRGDGLTLGALASFSGGLAFGLVGYTTPVGSDGLRIGGSVSTFAYKFDKYVLPVDIKGNAVAANLYSLYPVVRSRNLNLFALGSLEHKRFDDKQRGDTDIDVKKNSTELRLALSGDFRDDALTGGVSTYEVAGTLGTVQGAAEGDDKIGKIGFGYSRLQNIVTGRLLGYLNLRGQVAFDNLDSTQQFRLGGADGVRAFAPGELPGDSGAVLSLELRLLPPTAWFGDVARELVLSAFYDIGNIRFRTDTSGFDEPVDNRGTLSGVGVGLAWERPRSFNLRVYLAEPTSGKATGDPKERHPRIYALFSKQL